ncbi:MAG TPA: hypothetical protein VHM91_24575, partial [Verrucomicrobiales bacterium]|nr:hypothetical protein [Verrucomicrobiales bacterium]
LRLLLLTCFLFTLAGALVLVHDLRTRKEQDRLLAELPLALSRVPESFDAGPPIDRFRQACAALAAAHTLTPAEVEHGLEDRARKIEAVFPGSVHTAASLALAYVSEQPRAPATLEQRELGTPWYRGTAEYRALLAFRRTWQQEGDPEVLRTRACYVRACYYEGKNEAFRTAVDDLLRVCRTVPLPPDEPLLNALTASATGLRRIGDIPREEALWRLLIATCEKAEQQGRVFSLRFVISGGTTGLESMRGRLAECQHIQKILRGER